MKKLFSCVLLISFLASCKVAQPISESGKKKQVDFYQEKAEQFLLQHPAFQPAHLGVSVFNPASGQFLYNYQSDKYFIPASNTKIFTCYAAMKNLGDSLIAFQYLNDEDNITLRFTGDPSYVT